MKSLIGLLFFCLLPFGLSGRTCNCPCIEGLTSRLNEEASARGCSRQLDHTVLQELNEFFDSHRGYLVMRHGEQWKSPAVATLPNAALQKIAMMRHEDNVSNPLTEKSQVEAELMAQALRAVISPEQHPLGLYTSGNARAKMTAEILGTAIGVCVEANPVLDCVDYPAEASMPTEELLTLLPTGSLPWEPVQVDAVLGLGSYERIHLEMAEDLAGKREQNSLLVTHTQQINAIAEQYGLPVERLSTYGFILVNLEEGTAKTYKHGVFQEPGK